MAEIRKHKPGASSAIGDQVRATLGAGPRPVEPGFEPDAETSPRFDPFYSPDDDASDEPNAASGVPGFAAVSLGTEGWFSVDAAALAAGKPAAAPATADDEDDDED